jgi:hypothetical protein
MRNLGNSNELLVEMVAATLEDLKPPRGLALDPMPGKDAGHDVYQEWVDRHTIIQKESEGSGKVFYIGDNIYNYYTARAVLNGMSFGVKNESYTLQTALLQMGVVDPESVIESWKRDTPSAVMTGKKLMDLLGGSGTHRKNDARINDEIFHNDEHDDELEMSMPYTDVQTNYSRPLQVLD